MGEEGSGEMSKLVTREGQGEITRNRSIKKDGTRHKMFKTALIALGGLFLVNMILMRVF